VAQVILSSIATSIMTVVRAILAAWKIHRRSVRAARSCSLLCDCALCDNSVEPRDIFQHALAGQDEKVIAELRVVKVDLEQLFVGDGQYMPFLGAFNRRCPPVIGRKETKFAHQTSRRKFDTDFFHQEVSGDGQEHFVGCVVRF